MAMRLIRAAVIVGGVVEMAALAGLIWLFSGANDDLGQNISEPLIQLFIAGLVGFAGPALVCGILGRYLRVALALELLGLVGVLGFLRFA